LVYVSLDLSLPSMPGAFVFDPADSVESVQNGRARPGISAISELPGTRDEEAAVTPDIRICRDFVPRVPRICGPSLPHAAPRGDRARAAANHLAPPSEDPH
jgi:hypothetical protein